MSNAQFLDLAGQRFGKLLVLIKTEKPTHAKSNSAHFLCKCDCGKEKIIRSDSLRTGKSKSCGCGIVEAQKRDPHYTTHKMSKSRAYKSWGGMIQRCENPNNGQHRNYGARGITVCERWHKFENFLADMGEPPPKHSIDRIANNGNYEPGNCKWATQKEQNNHYRRNIFIEYNGQNKTLLSWTEELHLPYKATWQRLRRGWSVESAFTSCR